MARPKSTYQIEIKFHRNKRCEESTILQSAARFFLDELLHNDPKKYKIRIIVKLSPTVIADDGSTNQGLMDQIKKDGKEWYVLTLDNKDSTLDLISTLAHEIVHVVQFVTGTLSGGDNWIWNGIDYGPSPYTGNPIDNTLPWEYDAYSLEPILATKFITHYYSNW